jgi:hypothetical protein
MLEQKGKNFIVPKNKQRNKLITHSFYKFGANMNKSTVIELLF